MGFVRAQSGANWVQEGTERRFSVITSAVVQFLGLCVVEVPFLWNQ